MRKDRANSTGHTQKIASYQRVLRKKGLCVPASLLLGPMMLPVATRMHYFSSQDMYVVIRARSDLFVGYVSVLPRSMSPQTPPPPPLSVLRVLFSGVCLKDIWGHCEL